MRDQLSRFHLITDRAELIAPYCSAFNRSQDEEYFIDTDLDGDDGRIYIGKTDFEQLARLVGWGPPASSNDKETIAQLQKENNDVLALFTRLRDVANDLLARTEPVPDSPTSPGTVITAGGVVNSLSAIQPGRRIKSSHGEDTDGTEISV